MVGFRGSRLLPPADGRGWSGAGAPAGAGVRPWWGPEGGLGRAGAGWTHVDAGRGAGAAGCKSGVTQGEESPRFGAGERPVAFEAGSSGAGTFRAGKC